jgi:hypothetical protein
MYRFSNSFWVDSRTPSPQGLSAAPCFSRILVTLLNAAYNLYLPHIPLVLTMNTTCIHAEYNLYTCRIQVVYGIKQGDIRH